MNIEDIKNSSLKDDSLRDYQKENKQKIYDAWLKCNSVMLQMPTGTGKTRLFVSIIKDIHNYSNKQKKAFKVLVLVHRSELIDQIDEELGFRYGLAHGIIQSGNKERKIYPTQIASVQTLRNRLERWVDKQFDFIIVDEAHHITANSYQKIIKAFPEAKILGVTATPVRLNGEGFTSTFDELIVSPSIKNFIDKGYLSQYEYYSVARSSFIQQEIDKIKKFSQGDYDESELVRICDNDKIRAQVVQTYLDFANGKKGIVYAVNKEHNKNLCEEFRAKGVRAVAIDSDTPSDKREMYIRQFRNGNFDIICNVNIFTEGFDCPDIEFIQLARPTKSLALYLQQVGRGLRISENKEKTIFLDNVGLYNRFGFPSSRRHWHHHFIGKYKGNKSEEEVEGKKNLSLLSENKNRKPQTIEEGHEKVHLIQTTDEIAYITSRAEQLKKWLIDYFHLCLELGDGIIKEEKNSPINIYNGLSLTTDLIKQRRSNYCFNLKIVDEKLLKEILDICEFHFSEIGDDDEIKISESRLCKDSSELLVTLTEGFHSRINFLKKKYFKTIKERFYSLHFSYSELYDIINMLYESKCVIEVKLDDSESYKLPFGRIIEDLLYSCWYNKGKKFKTDMEYMYYDVWLQSHIEHYIDYYNSTPESERENLIHLFLSNSYFS